MLQLSLEDFVLKFVVNKASSNLLVFSESEKFICSELGCREIRGLCAQARYYGARLDDHVRLEFVLATSHYFEQTAFESFRQWMVNYD